MFIEDSKGRMINANKLSRFERVGEYYRGVDGDDSYRFPVSNVEGHFSFDFMIPCAGGYKALIPVDNETEFLKVPIIAWAVSASGWVRAIPVASNDIELPDVLEVSTGRVFSPGFFEGHWNTLAEYEAYRRAEKDTATLSQSDATDGATSPGRE